MEIFKQTLIILKNWLTKQLAKITKNYRCYIGCKLRPKGSQVRVASIELPGESTISTRCRYCKKVNTVAISEELRRL